MRTYFAEMECMEYICGLWTFDIIRGLGWYVEHWNRSEIELYRASSWSWAAVYSGIWYPALIGSPHDHWDEYQKGARPLPFNDTSYITILSVRVHAFGVNTFSAITSGKTTLPGPITPWMYVMLVNEEIFREHFALHVDDMRAVPIQQGIPPLESRELLDPGRKSANPAA